MDIELHRLDDELLELLLDAAVAGADPLEVMPPVDGPPGWTDARRYAFRAFHRERSVRTPFPVETTWAVVCDGSVVGAARLEPVDARTEAGIWLTRQARGRGVGRIVTAALLDHARESGAGAVVAETTSDNAGAIGLLRGLGGDLSDDGAQVHGEIRLQP